MIFTAITVNRTFKKITIKLNKIFAINFKILYIMIFIRITPLKLQIFPSTLRGGKAIPEKIKPFCKSHEKLYFYLNYGKFALWMRNLFDFSVKNSEYTMFFLRNFFDDKFVSHRFLWIIE